MNPRVSRQKTAALTLVEVLVIVFVLAVLAAIILPAIPHKYDERKYSQCVNNLKQVGLAFRIWEGDNNDKYPMQVSVTNGGTMELVATGNVVATFQVMSNELSTPKVVVCPQDLSRNYAANFTTDFNNSRISYFIGVDANDNFPQSVLSGDANFEIGGIPTKYGLLELSTNLNVAWTSARHFVGGSQFWKPTWHKSFGNFVFADGSVWSMDDKLLVQKLIETGLATNRLAIP